jgi:hypothetical protein
MESIFAHLKANASAVLFLCQECRRDRVKRGKAFEKPATTLAAPGSDFKNQEVLKKSGPKSSAVF